MGEVYRATDRNLKRSVAIKVLPAVMASDADRLSRFRREAEVLAALLQFHESFTRQAAAFLASESPSAPY